MSRKLESKSKKQRELEVQAAKEAARYAHELAAGSLARIKWTEMGQKLKEPTKIDRMESRLLKLLAGWSILDIECLLVHRVIPEAKRRATVPK